MRHNKCVFRYRKMGDLSPRKQANLVKAVQREAESVALLPELRRFKSAEEREWQLLKSWNQWVHQFRAHNVTQWRRARQLLREHPKRKEILASWNRAWLPGDANYLLSLIQSPRD